MNEERSVNPVGLCAACEHARVLCNQRSTFYRCGLAALDPRYPKFPRLPVLHCAGYAPRGRPPIESH